MADISKITTLDGTEYNIKDATARSLISNLPANNLQNLVDGSATGSVRGISTSAENSSYTIGTYAFAEGLDTKASGSAAHAEGRNNAATGDYSHVEGRASTASGQFSHAEGAGAVASGEASHAEGAGTEASGSSSHAEGYKTIANHKYQHVFGEYNIADPDVVISSRGTYVEIVGNGTDPTSRSNARTLDWNGNEWLAGGESIGGDLVLRDGNFYLDTDQFTLGTVPSENIYPLNRIYFRDANGNHVGQLYHHYLSDGEAGVLIEAKRSINDENIYNTMRLSIDDSGNKTVALSDGGLPFRKALGLGTNGALPITVAQGGTGVTTATKNQVFAAPNGSNGAPSFRALVAADIPTLATSKISGLDTTLDGKVDVAGDTMTGNLTISEAAESILYLKNTAATMGTAPSSDAYTGQIGFRTNTALTVGWVDHRYTKAKASQIRIAARNNGTGSNVDNVLIIGVDNDGTRTVTVSSAAAWRTGLGLGTAATRDATASITSGSTDLLTSGGAYTALDGKVATAGDTMTGNLSFTGTHGIYENHASCVIGTAPSSTAYNIGYRFRDKNSTTYAYLRGFFGTDNAVGAQFEVTRSVSGSAKYHNLTLRLKDDGTRQVTVSEQEPWLVGLGLSQTAVTITKPTTTPSGISTNGTFRCYTAGHVVMVQWESLLTTASPATSWTQLATGFPKPSNNIYFEGNCQNATAGNRMRFRITTGGVLQYAYGTPSATHAGTITYIIP